MFDRTPLQTGSDTVYVTVELAFTSDGSNVLPVTPFPDHVPPAWPVTRSSRLIIAVELQINPGFVQLAFGP